MRKSLVCSLLLLFVFMPVSAWGDVPIDEAHFPDEIFRRIVKMYDNGWEETDSDGNRYIVGEDDGILSSQEIRYTSFLNLDHTDIWGIYDLDLDAITTLKGIEYFSNLEELVCTDKKQLTELDLSGCQTLKRLDCSDNHLTELDVSGCSALTYLDCFDNHLTELDVSGCSALMYLDCGREWSDGNKLTELDVSGCSALTYLNCSGHQLTELDLSGKSALKNLYCSSNQLTELDVSGCPDLETLMCAGNQLTELNLSGNSVLNGLDCRDNQLTKLDVSGCPALGTLYCSYNQLTELDLSGYHGRWWIECGDHQETGGLRVKKTSDGYEVNMNNYVSHPENVENLKSSSQLISYSKETGIAVFRDFITYIGYDYNTGIYNEEGEPRVLMHVSIKGILCAGDLGISALERKGFEDDTIIRDMTDNSYLNSNGNPLTESDISRYSYGDYGKLGLAADGNIIRVRTRKPGTASFSFKEDIGAKLESLSRKELSASDQLTTTEIGTNIHQVSVVLIAPERFPDNKFFPLDTFKVNVNFTDEDGVAEDTLELKIRAAPVLLIPGMFDNAEKLFGVNNNSGIFSILLANNFDKEHIDVWDYQALQSPNALLGKDRNPLYLKLRNMFSKYAEKGIVCTRADIVAFGLGGLMAEKYLEDDRKDSTDGNNWSICSYKQGMVRRLVTIATPYYGTPIAEFLAAAGDALKDTEIGITSAMTGKILDFILSKTLNVTIFKDIQEFLSEMLNQYNGASLTVPTHAFYGDVSGVINTIQDFLGMIDNVTGSDEYASMARIAAFTHPEAALVMLCVSLGVKAAQMPGALINNVIFNGQEHDLMVNAPSAMGGLSDEAISSLIGWEYRHSAVCKQSEVGASIAYLLKGSLDNFDYSSAAHVSSTRMKAVPVKSSASSPFTADDSIFSEALELNVTPSLFILKENTSQVVTFQATSENAVSEMYCAIGNEEGYKFFKLSDAGKTGKNFEGKIEFTNQDTGVMNVFCFANDPNGKDGIGLYVSNTVNVASFAELNGINIVKLYVSGLSPLTLAEYTQTPAKLYAVAEDGKYYDVSSPLAGTVWTSSNPEIADVDESGVIHALSSGTAILTAEYEGLTASIKVTVEAQPEHYTIFTEANFPDENFRNFIINNCDYNGNGQISDEEISSTKTLDISGQGITSLKGIEYFTSLEYLDCRDNNLTVIDITGLQNLDPAKFFHDDGVNIYDGLLKPAFKSASLILSGQIGVNFFLDLPEIQGVNYYDGNSCYMGFNINGDTSSNNPQPTDGSFTSSGRYGYRCYINSVQMADPITADFHYGDGKTVSYVYTVKRYLDNKINSSTNPLMRELAVSIKDYGYYAQVYLSRINGWALGAKHIELEAATDYTAEDIEVVRQIADQYAPVRDDYDGTGLQGINYSLSLAAETTINLTIKMSAEYSGSVFASLNGGTENVAVLQPDGTYMVQISGISAHRLGDTQTVKVTAAKDFTIKVSALTFSYTSLKGVNIPEDRQKLGVALYNYYKCSVAYKSQN